MSPKIFPLTSHDNYDHVSLILQNRQAEFFPQAENGDDLSPEINDPSIRAGAFGT